MAATAEKPHSWGVVLSPQVHLRVASQKANSGVSEPSQTPDPSRLSPKPGGKRAGRPSLPRPAPSRRSRQTPGCFPSPSPEKHATKSLRRCLQLMMSGYSIHVPWAGILSHASRKADIKPSNLSEKWITKLSLRKFGVFISISSISVKLDTQMGVRLGAEVAERTPGETVSAGPHPLTLLTNFVTAKVA